MVEKLPEHLGGHLGRTHIDKGVLQKCRDLFDFKTMIDIGCGPGGQSLLALDMGFEFVEGVDGDFTIDRPKRENLKWTVLDYTKTAYDPGMDFDLAWSCEFVEHVPEEFVPNFMTTFKRAKFVCMTFYPPGGKPNKWHFNERDQNYWVDVFTKNGYSYLPEITGVLREASTMNKPFFKTNGLVFGSHK